MMKCILFDGFYLYYVIYLNYYVINLGLEHRLSFKNCFLLV